MLQRLFCSISISRIQPAKHQGSQGCSNRGQTSSPRRKQRQNTKAHKGVSNCGHTSSPRGKQQQQAQHSTKAHEGVPTTNGRAGGRSRPSACVLTVHVQCTHSARHSARAANGVNSTSSVEMAWNQIKYPETCFFFVLKPRGHFLWYLQRFQPVHCGRALCVHCTCTVRALSKHTSWGWKHTRLMQKPRMAGENRKRLRNCRWHMSPSVSMNWFWRLWRIQKIFYYS